MVSLLTTTLLLFRITNILWTVSSLPNIVLILTDDEDVTLSEEYISKYNIMPTRDKIFKTNGIKFNNAYSSTPTCCVSRSSILTGKYTHNHNVLNNTINGNCWGNDFQTFNEPYTYASYLNDIGYNTFFAGKYLNRYTDATSIPKGWNDWHALVGKIDYYNYHLSNNGFRVYYDNSDPNNYHTTVIKNFALNFLIDHNTKYSNTNKPFLLVLSTIAAHSPFTVEDKYMSIMETEGNDIIAPRTPNWNKINNLKDHHNVISSQLPMNEKQVKESDYIFKHRLYTLKSVDDAINDIYNYIQNEMNINVLDNTYFIYSSDHGFHSGQFGMGFAKMQFYETDIKIPFYISNSGENIYKGINVNIMANNIDIAPTILDLAGINYEIDTDMDGKSLMPYILIENKMNLQIEKQMFLIEYNGEGYNHIDFRMCDSHIDGFDFVKCDSWNNTFLCIRGINNNENFIYCNFKCYSEGRIETECERKYNHVETKGEYYDLNDDPFQMNNLWNSLSEEEIKYYNDKINEFKMCSGNECRQLFGSVSNVIVDDIEMVNEKSSFYDISRFLAFLTY